MSSMEPEQFSPHPGPPPAPQQQQPAPSQTTAAADSGVRPQERGGARGPRGSTGGGSGGVNSDGDEISGGGNSGGGAGGGGSSGRRQGAPAARDTRNSGAGGGRGSSLAAVLAALALGLILGGAATAFYLQAADDGDGFAGQVDTTRYQAVILSNDKVYFGRIDSISDDFFRLRSAFFLRETTSTSGGEPVRALLPVNREIHAPDNTLLIRKADVILVENLAKDSPILKEIQRQVGNG